MAEAQRDPRLGASIREFVLRERVAASAVATVYRASGPSGAVALKLYESFVTPEPGPSTAVQRELRHPAVARLLDAGVLDDGGYFIATEWIDGIPLSAWIDRRSPWESIRRVVGAIGSGLGALHARGVVHRDLKPSNVIVPSGHACAAVIIDASPALGVATPEPATGVTHGTPPYAAPERAAGLPLDGRADLYALGVILFQLLTGVLPADDEHGSAISPRLRMPERDIPRVADALCAWLLARDRDARLPNAHVLAVTIGAASSDLVALCGATFEARSPA